jgi:hypothetical protein
LTAEHIPPQTRRGRPPTGPKNIPHDQSAPIIALERNGEQRDCATKVCSGAGFTRLPQMLADHDALIIGNGQQSPIVVMTSTPGPAHADAGASAMRPSRC